jgi:formylmethanofuran dehydrogenase subunit E
MSFDEEPSDEDTEQLVVNVGEGASKLSELVAEAASSLDHAEMYFYEPNDRRYLKLANGKWVQIEYMAKAFLVDSVQCAECCEEIALDQVNDTHDTDPVCAECANGEGVKE